MKQFILLFDTWGHSPEDQYNTNVSTNVSASI